MNNFFETSKYFTLKKSTYVFLRWIGILGQLFSISLVYFILDFKFDYFACFSIIFIGGISNLYLDFIYKKVQISEQTSFLFLVFDTLQLSILVYLTGGITNPFIIFLIIPSVFSAANLGFRINLSLVVITSIIILFLTFNYQPLPSPLNIDNQLNQYVYYAIPLALIIALVFLNYFALSFVKDSRIRKEALHRMEEVMAKEHELLSLGGQAAAAAHSLGTPLSTIKLISQELSKQLKSDKEISKDIELLSSQIERCEEILKKLSVNPSEEVEFIDDDLSMRDYLRDITKSFEEVGNKKFIFNFDQDSNPKKISRSIEVVYGLKNFIGNAYKFSKETVFINLKSDSTMTEITIEDDGDGYPKDVIPKIGEPYLKTSNIEIKDKAGLGLGIFIGKTLLEKNFAKIICRNSKTRSGAEVLIKWKNRELFNI